MAADSAPPAPAAPCCLVTPPPGAPRQTHQTQGEGAQQGCNQHRQDLATGVGAVRHTLGTVPQGQGI